MSTSNLAKGIKNNELEDFSKHKASSKDGSIKKSQTKKILPEAGQAIGVLAGIKNEILTTEGGETDALVLVQNGLKAQQLIADMLNEEDEDTNLNEFEDGRKSRLEFQKLQVIDIATGIISMLGVALTVIAVIYLISRNN